MEHNLAVNQISVGVVGLGLMGSSIVAALLIAGHPVVAIAPLPVDMELAPQRIADQLRHCEKAALLSHAPADYLAQLTVTDDYSQLQECRLVLECVIENLAIKETVYQKIEAVVSPEAVIASNTSAIPISILQHYISRPERFLGIHWAEPAYMTRFMEITCGDQTAMPYADWAFQLAHEWQKEPTLLRKDIRGFVTNRLMYAIYREALHLIDTEEASMEDVDKAFRYDVGSWVTLMGIFRRLDYLGLQDFSEIFKNLFPKLSNDDRVPAVMQRMIDLKARGTQSVQGLYDYTDEEARRWDEAFAVFNQDIYQLAAQYPAVRENQKP
ncbi:3-hydroxyacyl-CoA dehydrogenase family protein [Larkinella knui]|uniref:3-hydroxyacyl-CoA dehydrogenase family protein n=1 Tax=Larkinella knui TaxID=2025310 RepID=A0A3P1CNH4_9BACT|nr:3-hydroxyacyl-CoA dehydrogenase family protein [Larkinella knui]RRB14877.1 3-hydroxyacyl-CoA dehydrogenase family protein [Larkinella knui]